MNQTLSMQARLQEQLAEVQAQERDLDRNLVAYEQMVADEERLSDQIAEVEARLTEASHAMRDQSQVRLHLMQPPQEAVEPSRPDYVIYLVGGALLSLAGGIGFAFLRELTDQAVRTPVDVARLCHL